jgi:CBS domain containing-hemolysin-like protein
METRVMMQEETRDTSGRYVIANNNTIPEKKQNIKLHHLTGGFAIFHVEGGEIWKLNVAMRHAAWY